MKRTIALSSGSLESSDVRALNLSVPDLKRVVRAMIGAGVRYADIAAVTAIDPNTLKQFVHRRSNSPRKTPVFYALSSFLNRVHPSIIDTICKNEHSLKRIMWKAEGPPERPSPINNPSNGTWRQVADIIEEAQPFETKFLSTYVALQPSYESSYGNHPRVIRSRIDLKFTHSNGAHFIHEQTSSLNAIRQVSGSVIANRTTAYFVGTVENTGVCEVILFGLPAMEKVYEKQYTDIQDDSRKDTKYNHMYGIVLAPDILSNPVACRIVAIAPELASSQELAVVEQKDLNPVERQLLTHVEKETEIPFIKSRLKPLQSRFLI